MESKRQHLAKLSRSLETVSPLATLSRGYSITARQTDGTLLRSAENIRVGEIVETRLANGSLICCVQKIRKS
jgi:exodeoxyribonuclease VII large subunit